MFDDVVMNFLRNTGAKHYTEIVLKQLLESYIALGWNISIKVYFLHSHLANFPENLGAASDEQVDRFHQDLKVMACSAGFSNYYNQPSVCSPEN